MIRIFIPARLAGAMAMLVLLFMGSIGTLHGVRCTIDGKAYLHRGPRYSGRGTMVSDRTRLYGLGSTVMGLSALAAAVMVPVVPLHSRGAWPNGRPRFSLPWRVLGYVAGVGFSMIMIGVFASVR
jgi:hypothetical protein